MSKYTPHVLGGLGLLTVLHLFFREFVLDVIQRAADGSIKKIKKGWKRLTKKKRKRGKHK